ncbi:MAG: T9SS type A sorting domain-containing protein [Muribaculaceae bacterium]|nr:T9SS type A sorting domain-containing protein [Muribaculaceae bacterium]
MKRFALILAVAAAFIPASAESLQANVFYLPMVEEGKTWWYLAQNTEYQEINYGVRITESTVIDEVEWHTCRFVDGNNPTEVLDPVVAYVREEDQKIYYKPVDEIAEFSDPLFSEIAQCTLTFFPGMENEILVYDWSLGWGETFESVLFSPRLVINDGNSIVNCGIQRHIQTILIKPTGETESTYTQAEGIGFADNDWSSYFFFLLPQRPGFKKWGLFFVGVTDAENNVVWTFNDSIFDPWEYSGIDEVVANETPSWNLSDGIFTSREDGVLHIYNMSGYPVVKERVEANTPTSLQLAKGIYVLELKTATGTQHGKIMR